MTQLNARCFTALIVGAWAGVAACGGDDDPDPAPAADTVAEDVAPPTGLGIDYGGTSGGEQIRFEPGGDGLTSVPWPNDRWRGADGSVDLSNFPNPANIALINDYLAYGMETLDGFGRNGSVYFEVGQLDMATLPTTEASLDDPRATVQFFNATTDSPDFGKRLPLLFSWMTGQDDPFVEGSMLAIRPVYGFPLNDSETYCVVVSRAVKDSQGRYLEVPPAFTDALTNDPTLQPLRAWLPSSPLAEADIASATCFTTQDATGEMRAIERFVATAPTTELSDISYNGTTTQFHEITATYVAPNYQAGTKPYLSTGGHLEIDADGVPVVQSDETIRVRILIPRNKPMPDEGWPVVLYSHGTFGDWTTCLGGNRVDILSDGLVMICIDQPLHGDRGVGDDDNILNSFNFINPRAGRMSFRQAAADTLWLSHMIAEGRFDFTAEASGFDTAITMNADNIVFFGHSHGGLAGAIVLGVDPRLKGAIISGAAGVLVETILRRKDPTDISRLLALTLNIDESLLDTFHPVMTIAQQLVDATDPINYAPYWLSPVTGGNSKHLFMTEGTLDAASPAVGTDALAAAGGLPVIEPVANYADAFRLRGLAPVTMPVNSNLISDTGQLITAGLRQFEGGDHWVALTDPIAQQIWRGFLRAFRDGDIPIIAP